jgi:perosamine synthetase
MAILPRYLPPTATPMPFSLLARSWFARTGAVTVFGQALQDYLAARACYTAASGRTALFLGLHALQQVAGSGLRKEVLLPAYTCPSLVPVIEAAGLTARLVDIDPQSLAFVPAQLEAAAGAHTLAILGVHPFGLITPLEPLLCLARAVGAFVIEDAAQAVGAKVAGRAIGLDGDIGLYSFGPGKPLAAGGGGAVATRRGDVAEALAEVCRELPSLRGAAPAKASLMLTAFSVAFHPVGWWFAAKLGAQQVGDNEKHRGFRRQAMAPAQAAAALALLPELDQLNWERRRNGLALAGALATLPGVVLPGLPPEGAATGTGVALAPQEPALLRLPVLVDDELLRDRLVARLQNAQIGAGKMYKKTLAELFPTLAQAPDGYPGATQVARTLLTLPTHHYVTAADRQRIVELIRVELGV